MSEKYALKGKEVKYLFVKAHRHSILPKEEDMERSTASELCKINNSYGGMAKSEEPHSDLYELVVDLEVLNHVKRHEGKPKEKFEELKGDNRLSVLSMGTIVMRIYEEIAHPF